ncbi:hypothetical protein [Deinococcus sp. 12RED42]|uniref:hypothetical protein n=1 Tax=Deinococcus sp. 12RED42 TaxID=2745872 RepID=UPI001E5BDAC6|nr:hypothetical protein [Deinococcus sp. 12RED42]
MGVRSAQECPVEDEFAWLRGGKKRQDDPGDVGWLDGMPVKEAFHTADDEGSVRASGEARGEFGMPDVLALEECEHYEGKQLDLILAELREVRGEEAGQLGQDIGRRVLFSRVSRTFSSPSGNYRVLSPHGPHDVQASRRRHFCNIVNMLSGGQFCQAVRVILDLTEDEYLMRLLSLERSVDDHT